MHCAGTAKTLVFALRCGALFLKTFIAPKNNSLEERIMFMANPTPYHPRWNSAPIFHPYYGWVCDQLQFGPNLWIEPRSLVVNLPREPEKHFEAKRLFKLASGYFMRERDGREVYTGLGEQNEKFFVNQQRDGTFAAYFCQQRYGDQKETHAVAVPFKDFLRRNAFTHLMDYPKNDDCPDSYVNAAFFDAVQKGDPPKILMLPKCSGWQIVDGKYFFMSNESVIDVLEPYYPPDVLRRKLIQTDMSLVETAKALAAVLPADWRYKFLLVVSTMSLLLLLFAEKGMQPDQMYFVEPGNDQNALAATALLSTWDYQSTATQSLLKCRTDLQHELDQMHDGTVVFRDSSLLEAKKQRMNGLDVVVQDLRRGLGVDDVSRHIIAVISDNIGFYPSEIPAFYLSLSGCPRVEDVGGLQKAVGCFHTALIRLISNSSSERNLFTEAFDRIVPEPDIIRNADCRMSKTMLRTTMKILLEYGLLSSSEAVSIGNYLKRDTHAAADSGLSIVNEFRETLSAAILDRRIKVFKQQGPPYFNSSPFSAFADRDYINFTEPSFDWLIAPMRTTKRRNNVLSALKACGMLHCSNFFKRLVDVEVASETIKALNVYSVSKSVLSPKARAKIDRLSQADYLFSTQDFPAGFVPILSVAGNMAAGRVITEATDEAESIFMSGQTRSGKTCSAVQQAIIRAELDNTVILIDQTGGFRMDELKKHLPGELIDKYFSFWSISTDGVPVDLLSLEKCDTLPDKKNRLLSILSVAARVTGQVQERVLRRRLSPIVKAVEAGQVRNLPETLRFFDENDPDQAEIRGRLEGVLDDLERLPTHYRNWDDFMRTQSKIAVITLPEEGVRNSKALVDMLLASLFSFKQHYRTGRCTVILDELEDLCLDREGPISLILRKGGKFGLSMILATQEFSTEKDNLGRLIGNCGLKVFFRPKDANLREISKYTGVSSQQLAALQQGECVVTGGFYSKMSGRNKQTTLRGKTYSAAKYLHLEPETDGTEAEVEPAEAQPDSQDLQTKQQEIPEQNEKEPDESLPEPLVLPPEQSSTADTEDDTPEGSHSETSELTLIETALSESEIAETETQPVLPDSDPDVPEEDPQERIEQDLQRQFQELKRRFNPDYPGWKNLLAELFKQIKKRHRCASPSNHDKLETRLNSFLQISTESYDYLGEMNKLFHEVWPDACQQSRA